MDRRSFLKRIGFGAVALAAVPFSLIAGRKETLEEAMERIWRECSRDPRKPDYIIAPDPESISWWKSYWGEK